MMHPDTRSTISYLTRWGARLVGGLLTAALLVGLPDAGSAQYFQFGKNKVQYGEKDWNYIQSEHFDVYYYEPGGRYLAQFTADAAEQAYDQIAEDFEYDLSDRIPILVYQSHNEFSVTNAVNLPVNAEGIGGVTELFKNRVAIPFTGDYREYRRVVHHELVHAVINDMFYGGSIQNIIQNNISLQIPLWFNEGIAEYEALGWDTQSDMYVREAVVNDNLPPIRGLNGFMAYRGGQAVWDFLSEQYGRQKIGEILQNIRLTRSVPSAFQRSTGLDLETLSERWHSTLKKVYFPEVSAREDLDEIAEAIVTPDQGNLYNTSPALSPSGNRVAFISTEGGFFNVYIARTEDGEIIKKLVSGQDNTQFESLRILEPNITWSPDGTKIALSAKSGPGDVVAVVDVESEETTHYRVPEMDAIITLSWHPDGDKIAFEGSKGPQSDIYVLNTETGQTVNYTNDLFSDHEPTWSPNGEFLVFHSDRGSYTQLASARPENFEMMRHDYSQMDLYRLNPGQSTLERLTSTAEWDEESASFGSDSNRMLFISDRNGIPNIYEKNLTTGRERPVTDLLVGVTQMSVSADGNRAALVSLKDGTPSIYVLKRPFDRTRKEPDLRPSVWAKRVQPESAGQAPAVELASSSLLESNPILRDATDDTPYLRRRYLAESTGYGTALLADAAPTGEETAGEGTGSEPTSAEGGESAEDGAAPADSAETSGGEDGEEESDDPGRIDFRDYDFSEGFDQAQAKKPPEENQTDLFNPPNNRTEDGEYRSKEYKISFSPDIIYGSAGFSSLYGVQGVTQMMFSDMLGNHEIFVATNLLIDLRNSDYFLSYSYRPQRIDWSVLGYHTSRLLPDYRRGSYMRYRNFGGGIGMKVPMDKFRRFDVELSALGVSQVALGNPGADSPNQLMLYPSVSYTKDNTTPGMLYPRDGIRWAMRLSGSPASLRGENVQFGTALLDWRWYHTFGRYFTWALRGSGGASFGPDPQLFYSSGVSNWINRRFDQDNGFPIYDATDFVFAQPVLPMRGTSISSMIGSRFGLVNAEFRFPLVTALIPGPLPIPLYNLQGAFFTDVGSIWGGRDGDFNLWRYNKFGRQVFDDLNVGAGFGIRSILLGYPVRFDWAWRHNGREWTNRRFYFSIGLDF